jgi:hypothetical protein
MECYTKEQCVIIVKMHYKYGESYAETVRKVRGIFGQQNAPYQSTDCKLLVHHCTGRSLDNIAAVSESVAESA